MRQLRSLVLICTVATILAGCGGGSSEETGGGRQSKGAGTTSESTAPASPFEERAERVNAEKRAAKQPAHGETKKPSKKIESRDKKQVEGGKSPSAVPRALEEEVERLREQAEGSLSREELEEMAERAIARAENLTPGPGQSAEDVIRAIEEARAEGVR